MLTELLVADLGVIGELSLVVEPGMTALTGETGAGKTLVVDAIDLLVGGRADASMVRRGADEAVVEGRFVLGDDEVVLRRVVPREGRSRAYRNGRLATVGELAEWGQRLVDLHGQHAHQSLLSAGVQRAALDRFGAVDLEPMRAARKELAAIDEHLASLGGDERERAREADLLRFQLAEVDGAAIESPDEDELLDAEESLLADAAAHREAAGSAVARLSTDGGAGEAVAAALGALDGRAPFDAIVERLRAVAAELADVVSELRSAGESIDEDPERLDAVRVRRKLLHDLRRKYGETLADVLAYRNEVAARLTELDAVEETAAALDASRQMALASVLEAERAVGRARRAAAPRLASAVEANLGSLALAKARLRVAVGEDPGDDVRVLLAANPGADALPLAKVASGGELARVMLALRLVLSEAPETLVFDEVDAGVGGAAALAVGQALAALAGEHQVLVVTHLAQVAAHADHQAVVTKREQRGSTVTSVAAVTGEERVTEVARMLSGTPDAAAARRNAEDLLARARR
jgi:DNA repair protein RecN (Recombination protein N)